MGRKVSPTGFRLAVSRDWKSRWFARGDDYAKLVVRDHQVRDCIRKQYPQASISKVEIEGGFKEVRVIIHTARPGIMIGKKGEGIEKLRVKMRKLLGTPNVQVDIEEVRQPEINAQLVASNVAGQLERRMMFRRTMRRAVSNAMRMGVEGIKIMTAGRLNGIEIARSEWYREGRVPLHTLKNDIDYGFAEAKTSTGIIGVKVWISSGDKFAQQKKVKYSLEDRVKESPADSDENGITPKDEAIVNGGAGDAEISNSSAPPQEASPSEEVTE